MGGGSILPPGSLISGLLDTALHVSPLALACIAIGWVRADFDDRTTLVRTAAWGIGLSVLAAIAMLSPFEPLPGLRIDVRAAFVVLGAVFGGLGAVTLTAAVEVALRLWIGGAFAAVGTIGIVLSFLPAAGYALAVGNRRRMPTVASLALLGLLAGAAGPAASFALDTETALRALGAGALLQMLGVLAGTLLFATIVSRTDRARRSMVALKEREAHLTEANRQLVELTVQLERRNHDYAEARDRAEQLLAQMNAIFDNAPFGISIKDIDGKIRAANAAYGQLMAQPVAALIGRRSDAFLAETDAVRARETDTEVARTGETQTVEYNTLTPGAPEWLWTIKFPIKSSIGEVTAIGGFDVDVTRLKRQTVALQRSAMQLRRMHEIAKIVYWYHEIGPDGTRRRIEGAPDDFLAMSGWSASESLDRENYLLKCVHAEDRARVRSTYADFDGRRVDSYSDEYRIVRPDGSVMPVKVWVQRVHEEDSGLDYIMGVMQDVTVQHEREARLADAMSRAEMSDRVKTEFLANLSHELRTPLNAVIGFAELLKLKLGAEAAAGLGQYADLITRGGQRLLTIVSQLLEIARLDFGARELIEVTIDVASTVASSVVQVQERFATRNVSLVCSTGEAGLALRCERVYFIQALMAVLTNAAQHSKRRGRVDVTTIVASGGDLEITVVDRGAGIPAELLPRLSAPFVHGESAFARKRNGPGLGLAMCRRILDMHGGRLRIESLPSETRVQLVYPAGRLERPGVALPGPVRAAAV